MEVQQIENLSKDSILKQLTALKESGVNIIFDDMLKKRKASEFFKPSVRITDPEVNQRVSVILTINPNDDLDRLQNKIDTANKLVVDAQEINDYKSKLEANDIQTKKEFDDAEAIAEARELELRKTSPFIYEFLEANMYTPNLKIIDPPSEEKRTELGPEH